MSVNKCNDTSALQEECSSSSTSSSAENSLQSEMDQENIIITPAMVVEEENLKAKFEQEEMELKKQYQGELNDVALQEVRYKRLMYLLKKSESFSSFLLKKFENAKSNESSSEPKRKAKKKNAAESVNPDLSSLKNKDVEVPATTPSASKSDETKITSLGVEVPIDQPDWLEGTALRDYQLEGFQWLKNSFEIGMNGILADEMGLGKTVQVIALLAYLYQQGVVGPFLIVGPLSTLPNWMIEFNRFAPSLPVVLYHGSKNERVAIRPQIAPKYKIGSKKVFPVVVTSYQVPLFDSTYLKNIKWNYIVVDEGHRLKNFNTLLTRMLNTFYSVNRLLLTGTPLQNNLTELWSLLNFLMPDIFDDVDAFHVWLEAEQLQNYLNNSEDIIKKERETQVLSTLHKILAPFLLRRIKSEVNLTLPGKKEVLVYCPMTKVQHTLYSKILDRSIEKCNKYHSHVQQTDLIIPCNPDGTKRKRRAALIALDFNAKFAKFENSKQFYTEESKAICLDDYEFESFLADEKEKSSGKEFKFNINLRNVGVMLKQVANHPHLVKAPVIPGTQKMLIDSTLIQHSGKMIMLETMLEKLKAAGHKVLIFSTWCMLLDLIEELMIMKSYEYERLDGKSKIDCRKQSIYKFNSDPNSFVFLLSTRAGGLGINLTAADTVIIFDSDWNPQADLQAQDRCHRIGQTKPVVVYRFVSQHTIDERIVERADAKRTLEKMVIQQGKFKGCRSLQFKPEIETLKELRELLKKKDCSGRFYTKESALSEKEWDDLLDRSDLQT